VAKQASSDKAVSSSHVGTRARFATTAGQGPPPPPWRRVTVRMRARASHGPAAMRTSFAASLALCSMLAYKRRESKKKKIDRWTHMSPG
jgi:hypothetical protein